VQASTTHVIRVKPKRSFKAIQALVPRDPKVGSGGLRKVGKLDVHAWDSAQSQGVSYSNAHNPLGFELARRSQSVGALAYDKPIIGSVVPADLLSTARL
jgi:hypothetical protein